MGWCEAVGDEQEVRRCSKDFRAAEKMRIVQRKRIVQKFVLLKTQIIKNK